MTPSGFVKMSASCSCVLTYLSSTLLALTFSLSQWYFTSKCFVLSARHGLPVVSRASIEAAGCGPPVASLRRHCSSAQSKLMSSDDSSLPFSVPCPLMGAGALLAGSRALGPGPSFISTSGASPVSLTPSLMTAMRRRWSPIAHPQLPSDQQRAEEYEGGTASKTIRLRSDLLRGEH